jgi:hypothetical protein
MNFAPPERHLLRARDLADARYFEPLGVDDLARAAGLSRAGARRLVPGTGRLPRQLRDLRVARDAPALTPAAERVMIRL